MEVEFVTIIEFDLLDAVRWVANRQRGDALHTGGF